jgi:hypothetical protein
VTVKSNLKLKFQSPFSDSVIYLLQYEDIIANLFLHPQPAPALSSFPRFDPAKKQREKQA